MAGIQTTHDHHQHSNIDHDDSHDDDDDDEVRLKPCPCEEFGTIESIAKVLLADDDENPQRDKQPCIVDRHARLLEWLSSSSSLSWTKQHDKNNASCCCCANHRVNASLSILNAIRDACEPFLQHQSSSGTALVEPSSSSPFSPSFTMNENAFPSLSSSSSSASRVVATAATPGVWDGPNKQQQPQPQYSTAPHQSASSLKIKPKRRIRPASISLQVGSAIPASGPWGRNNNKSSSSISGVMETTTNSNSSNQTATATLPQQHHGGKAAPDILETRMQVTNPERQKGTHGWSSANKPREQSRVTLPPLAAAPSSSSSPVVVAVNDNSTNDTCANAGHDSGSKMMDSNVIISPTQVMLPHKKSGAKDHSIDIILARTPLNRLVHAYCVLIENYLVPSTALEVHLLLRLLAIPIAKPTPNSTDATSNQQGVVNIVVLRSMFTCATSCIYFAKHALERLSDILRGLGLMPYLVACPPFQQHCPQVTRDFQSLLQEQQTHNKTITNSGGTRPSTLLWKLQSTDSSSTTGSGGPSSRTALLTQSFNHARDSRHNYRSRQQQLFYNNREECRDSFLFQLRSFLHVRGGGGGGSRQGDGDEALVIQQVRTSSRLIIDKLLDANLGWFTEFFCDLLLQIGSIPHQETDKELLRIAGDDQDKLAKLHKRLSSKAAPTNKSSKKVVANAKRGGGTTTARNDNVSGSNSNSNTTIATSLPLAISDAQQAYFSGHQEFFFLFLVLADSYKFGLHLRSHLVAKMTELTSNPSMQDILESKMLDLQLVARFLGVLFFLSSSLSSSSDTPSVSCIGGSDDGVRQLAAAGLSMMDKVKRAWQTQNLVAVIPWVVEILKMSTWDKDPGQSSCYRQLLSLLRTIQIYSSPRTKAINEEQENKDTFSSSSSLASRELVSSCLETLFDDVVGLARIATLPLVESSCVLIARRISGDDGPGTLGDKKRDDAIGLDRSITIFSSSTLFACAPHVEDVVALISTITSQHTSLSLTSRAHGATRKLRPNAVVNNQTLQGTPSNGFGPHFQNTGDRAISAATLLQTKLIDTFFHRHQTLKEICEFTVSRVLCNMISVLPSECIDAIVNVQSYNDSDDPEGLLSEKARTAGHDFLKTALKENVCQSLDRLAPPETTSHVKEIACVLAVDQGMKTGRGIVDSVVSDRIKVAQNTKARNEKKRSLATETAATFGEEELDGLLPVIHHLEQAEKELSTITSHECDKALDALIAARFSLDSWISTMGNRFPPEQFLRSLFEAVLRLDEHSCSLFHAVFSTANPTPSTVTWPVLSEYLRVATRIRKFSRHGLANVSHFLSNVYSLLNVICLGLSAAAGNNDASELAPLVIDLMVSRLVSCAQLEQVCEHMATRVSTTTPQLFVNLLIEIVACSKKEPSLPLARLERLLSTHVPTPCT